MCDQPIIYVCNKSLPTNWQVLNLSWRKKKKAVTSLTLCVWFNLISVPAEVQTSYQWARDHCWDHQHVSLNSNLWLLLMSHLLWSTFLPWHDKWLCNRRPAANATCQRISCLPYYLVVLIKVISLSFFVDCLASTVLRSIGEIFLQACLWTWTWPCVAFFSDFLDFLWCAQLGPLLKDLVSLFSIFQPLLFLFWHDMV